MPSNAPSAPAQRHLARAILSLLMAGGFMMAVLLVWGITHGRLWPLGMFVFSFLVLLVHAHTSKGKPPTPARLFVLVLALPCMAFAALFAQAGLLVRHLFRRLMGYQGPAPLFSVEDQRERGMEQDWLAKNHAKAEKEHLDQHCPAGQVGDEPPPSRRRL